MALCPNCRHEASRHDASNQCGEPGCSCIFDPRGAVAFIGATDISSVKPTSLRPRPNQPVLRLSLDHPVGVLIALSFVAMAAVVGIERIEKGPPAILWLSQHRAATALVKQALCLIAIPGFFCMMFWSPYQKKKDWTASVPRGIAPAIGALAAAGIFYYALKLFLAAR